MQLPPPVGNPGVVDPRLQGDVGGALVRVQVVDGVGGACVGSETAVLVVTRCPADQHLRTGNAYSSRPGKGGGWTVDAASKSPSQSSHCKDKSER